MFINDRLIYLEMPKTGCTYISNVLYENLGGERRKKHSQLTFDPGERLVVGSIRNPWDWYVSLWAFGCSGKGMFATHVTQPRKTAAGLAQLLIWSIPRPRIMFGSFQEWLKVPEINYEQWRRLYGDPMDIGLFQKWLKYLLSPSGKTDLIEGYPESRLSEFAGFMTYRFVSLYSKNRVWPVIAKHVESEANLREMFSEYSIVDRIVHMEYLEPELLQILRDVGYQQPIRFGDPAHRTNTSRHLDFRHYYDREAEGLVAEEEKFLVDRFGYRPPSEEAASGPRDGSASTGTPVAESPQ